MKNFYKLLKPTTDAGGDLPKKENWYGKLYVAYLNQAMINNCATGHYTNDYNNNSRKEEASAFTASNGIHYNTDGIPVILSPDDEMMLYDEDSSEYY